MLLPIEPIHGMNCPPLCVPVAFYTNPQEDTCPIAVVYVSAHPHWTGAS